MAHVPLVDRRQRWLLLILVAILLGSAGLAAMPAWAQGTAGWVFTNPGGGGMFNRVFAGPGGLLIAASDLSGIYVSRDRGASWTPIGPAQGLPETHASAIGFDPRNPDVVLIGTEAGIYRSTDGARSFQRVLVSGYVHDVRLDTAQPGLGFATVHSAWNANDGQVYRTTNGGLTWAPVSNLPAGLRLLKLVPSPQSANTLYAISGAGRFAQGPQQIFRSDDGGVTWTRLIGTAGSVDLGGTPLMDIAFHPTDPAALYLSSFGVGAGVRGATFRSTDGGASWQQVASQGGVFFTDPARPNLVRRLDPTFQKPWESDSGVYESTDAGRTWTRVSNASTWPRGWQGDFAYDSNYDGPVASIGADLSDPNAIYWVTSQAVFGSFNGGRSFAPLFTRAVGGGWQSTGIDNVVMHGIAPSATNPNRVYAFFDDLGCWRTSDGGASWVNCNPSNTTLNHWGSVGGETRSLVVDPDNADVVWATFEGQGRSHVLLNTAAGAPTSWVDVSAGLPATTALSGLSLAPGDTLGQRTLFVTAGGDVYRSADGGQSWALSLDCDGCRVTAVDRFNPSLVYAGGEAGLRVSTDGGVSWASVSASESFSGGVAGMPDSYNWEGVFQIVPDPNVTGEVYLAAHGTGRGLWHGALSGGSWQWKELRDDNHLRGVAVTPGNGRILYAASSSAYTSGGYRADSGGVMRSTDGGATWASVNEGMTWPFALAVAVVPGDPSLVYVGSPGTGLATRRFALPTATATPTATPLALPVPVAPSGVISTSVPVFVWDGVAGALSYRIWVNEYATPNVPGKINQLYSAAAAGCSSGGRCSVSPGVSFASANAEWWVTAIMPDGSERLSVGTLFTVQPAPTSTPVPPTTTRSPTATPIPPTATRTPTAVPPTATRTATPIPPTATRTATATPTRTATPRPPTATPTRTATPIPLTPTRTATPAPATVPILVAPRGLITTSKPSFSWERVPGAVSYRLWVNEYATPNVPGKINRVYTATAAGCASTGRCQVSPGVTFAPASAEWWVTAIMPDGSERLSASATFRR